MLHHSVRTFSIMVSVAAVELCLATVCRAQLLPEPTGPYPVGRVTFNLVDASRDDEQGSQENHKREFMVQVWYPDNAARRGPHELHRYGGNQGFRTPR